MNIITKQFLAKIVRLTKVSFTVITRFLVCQINVKTCPLK